MSDLDRDELGALAPGIDIEASLALFERRRRRDRRRRRRALALVCVASLIGLAVAAAASQDRGAGRAVAGGHGSEVVSVTLEVDLDGELGDVRLIEDAATWREAVAGQEAPRIDFRHWVVVALTNDVPRCDHHLRGFDWDDGVLTPTFVEGRLGEPEGPWLCLLAARPETHAAAIHRADLPPAFDVRPGEGAVARALVVEATRTTTAEPDPAVGFEVVDVRRAPPGRAGDLRVIEDDATLRDTWAELGLGQRQTAPALDLDEQLVLMLTTSGGACPPELRGFTVEGHALAPVFRPVDDVTCGHEVTAHTFVVTLDRASVAELESIVLDGDTLLGIAPTTRDLDAAQGP
ncbi:hypothetical protein [Actinomarinicola tropica]|uniref:Uncharacterized protein n=1 Tax=Actinomarinicola tropica TaxID=2789776 RepID=A0A5Q2RLH1_9ACTN|nr:hypothetical protein [Actinomarinicola tropica]QGG95772.1 hypothetical protein GH723_12065 [Actinomarinicola tropica]